MFSFIFTSRLLLLLLCAALVSSIASPAPPPPGHRKRVKLQRPRSPPAEPLAPAQRIDTLAAAQHGAQLPRVQHGLARPTRRDDAEMTRLYRALDAAEREARRFISLHALHVEEPLHARLAAEGRKQQDIRDAAARERARAPDDAARRRIDQRARRQLDAARVGAHGAFVDHSLDGTAWRDRLHAEVAAMEAAVARLERWEGTPAGARRARWRSPLGPLGAQAARVRAELDFLQRMEAATTKDHLHYLVADEMGARRAGGPAELGGNFREALHADSGVLRAPTRHLPPRIQQHMEGLQHPQDPIQHGGLV